MSVEVIKEMKNEEYHAHGYVSSSQLRTILSQSLAHFIYSKNNHTPPTPAMEFGTAYHTLILEPQNFAKDYFTLDDNDRPCPDKDYKNTANREWKAEKIAENVHKSFVKKDEYEQLQAMREVINDNPFIVDLLEGCSFEDSFFTEIDGIGVRSRPDGYKDNVIIDLKTTADASPDGFGKSAANFKYHVQAALYHDILEQYDGKKRTFVFIAQEKQAPYIVQLYYVPEYLLDIGRREYKRALGLLKQAVKTGEFPGFESKEQGGIRELELPHWALREVKA